MSLYTLTSRREFAMGLASQMGLSGVKIKEIWRNSFNQLIEKQVTNPEEKDHFHELMKRITHDQKERAPLHFITLVDYSLLQAFMTLASKQVIADDAHLFDSQKMYGDNLPFFCRAGHFSYIRQKVRGTFTHYFKSSSSGDFFKKQAQMVESYYNYRLYQVRESKDKWIMEALDPPEAGRNDCLANIYIFYRGWLDLLSVSEAGSGAYHCKEEACVALGHPSCRFVFQKLV